MFRLASQRVGSRFLTPQRQSFSVFTKLLHGIRGYLNRIRWEENHEFRALDIKNSTVPRTTEQANQMFINTEQQAALSEQQRMQRIDSLLGTNTHFHEGKIFQERIDSDHLMEIDYLRKQNPEKSRKTLDWLNPQADFKVRYKNKKRYYQNLAQLRTYPSHTSQDLNLTDETSKSTIQFLGHETAYTAISLKSVELTMASLEQEAFFLPPEKPFSTEKYCYFRPQFTMQLLRVSKNLYNSSLLSDQKAITALGSAVEEVISLEEIYNALKDYDTDERVYQYLRKVQNDRVEYLFTDLSFDKNEETVALTLDILDDGVEHCVLVKSLVSPEKIMRPIFNLRPEVVFSRDGRYIFYIQRSPQGGWVQLVKRTVESCWGSSQLVLQTNEEAVFRCDPDKQLRLGKDSGNNFTFLIISDYAKRYSERLHLIRSNQDELKLIQVDEDGMCQFFYDVSSQGLIISKKRQIASGSIKYGNNKFYIESVELIPFKQHLQIRADTVGMTDLLPGTVQQLGMTPQGLDFDNKRTIFVPNQHEFITSIQVRQTHIVMTLNYFSVYDKSCLYCLPFKANSHPHSLILRGGSQLQLRSDTYSLNSQVVEYSHPQGPVMYDKIYNIWKRQLKQQQSLASRYHHQVFSLESNGYSFDINFSCKTIFLEEKELPVMLVILEQGEAFDQSALRQFLEKGVAVVQFCGRGTFTKDLQHFLAGSRHNFSNLLDDLQTTIEFIGNSMTKNISLYCKGEISSLVGLWFNVYFPYLFNSTVLHNGLYDLSDQAAVKARQDFFGEKKEGNVGFNFNKFDIFQHKFRMLLPTGAVQNRPQEEKLQFQIGQLQNVIISSSKEHRLHSRKLIKRLRENSMFRYNQVYLKEHEHPYLQDLFNLSYIYSRVRERLEREVHEMPQEEEETP